MTKSKKIKSVKAWAGVVEGSLHRWQPGNGNYYEIYAIKAEAEKCYEKIVRVKITPIVR